MGTPLRLATALGDYPHAHALHAGEITIAGVELAMVSVSPIIHAFRRMVRELAYDICEIAPTTYLIAREAGLPIVALPVFLMRRFHHADVRCAPGSAIRRPPDLEGRRVGIRAYSVTTAVWVRGLLSSEHGVDHRAVTWVTDDDEHVATLALPPNVERLAPGDSIAELFLRGRLDAALTGRAGVGRAGAPGAGWERASQRATDDYPLFPDATGDDARSFRSSGIYPLHALVCIREGLLDRAPWLPSALLQAFDAAKSAAHLDEDSIDGYASDRDHYRAMAELLEGDPLPYGVAANATTLEALIAYAQDQGLISTRPPLSDLFVT
jgi:4,5-dihydroxyphthalate decarboxylase